MIIIIITLFYTVSLLVLGVVLYSIESNMFLFIVVNGYMNKLSINISFVIYMYGLASFQIVLWINSTINTFSLLLMVWMFHCILCYIWCLLIMLVQLGTDISHSFQRGLSSSVMIVFVILLCYKKLCSFTPT